MPEIYDHAGNPAVHGRAHVNGIRMHYVTAGQGEPLLLLHGTPKNHFYWYKLIPLLTDHFTVVAPDLLRFRLDRQTAGRGMLRQPYQRNRSGRTHGPTRP